jgi:hypothetical protein
VCGVESIHGKKRQKRKSQYTSSAAATIIVNQKVKISSSVSLLLISILNTGKLMTQMEDFAPDSCLKCHRPFAISSRQPKVLSCLHSFCAPCCLTLGQQNSGEVICCPCCQIYTSLGDNGIPGLRDNFAVLRVLELREKEEMKNMKFSCNNCESNEAIWRCMQCDSACSNLCDNCKVQHSQMKALRSHILVSIEEFKNSSSPSLDNFVCPIHTSEFLEVYCQDCRSPVCLTCAVYDHHSHIRKTVGDGFAVESEDISKNVTDLHRAYDSYEEETTGVISVREQLIEQHDDLSNYLTTAFKELHEALDER